MQTEPLRTLRVALAPDVPLVIAGTTALLTACDPPMTVCELPRHRDASVRVDVVLYDPQRFHHRGGPVVALDQPRLTVIAYSWSTRADTIARARAQGAVGYLSKELDATTLTASIRALHAGYRARFVVRPPQSVDDPGRPDALTGRELEVLELITSGCSNDEIAHRLYLSINSVKTYIRAAYRKIGVTRRPQAVLWGMHHGITLHTQHSARQEPAVRAARDPG